MQRHGVRRHINYFRASASDQALAPMTDTLGSAVDGCGSTLMDCLVEKCRARDGGNDLRGVFAFSFSRFSADGILATAVVWWRGVRAERRREERQRNDNGNLFMPTKSPPATWSERGARLCIARSAVVADCTLQISLHFTSAEGPARPLYVAIGH